MNRPDRRRSEPAPLPPSRKEVRKLRSEIVTEKSRVLRPLEQRMSVLEKRIEKAEADMTRMNKEIVEASQARESGTIVELSQGAPPEAQGRGWLLEDLEPLLHEYEFKRAEFDRRLEDLDATEKGASG